MKSSKRMMECRNDTQKRSMLKKKQGQHLYSGSVLLCEIYHQTFYDPFIFCVSLRSALLLQSCFKWWEPRKIMKCVTTWGSLWKMFVQKLWAAAAVVGPQKGEPFAWWCLLMAAAPDPGLRSGHLLNVVGVSIWDLLLGLAPVIRLVTATLLLCISAPRSKSSCWYRGAAPPS